MSATTSPIGEVRHCNPSGALHEGVNFSDDSSLIGEATSCNSGPIELPLYDSSIHLELRNDDKRHAS